MSKNLQSELNEFFKSIEKKPKTKIDDSTVVMGFDSALDSINSVEFIMDLEEKYQIVLMDKVVKEVQEKGLVNLSFLNSIINS